jgi:hypothetical protein
VYFTSIPPLIVYGIGKFQLQYPESCPVFIAHYENAENIFIYKCYGKKGVVKTSGDYFEPKDGECKDSEEYLVEAHYLSEELGKEEFSFFWGLLFSFLIFHEVATRLSNTASSL